MLIPLYFKDELKDEYEKYMESTKEILALANRYTLENTEETYDRFDQRQAEIGCLRTGLVMAVTLCRAALENEMNKLINT